MTPCRLKYRYRRFLRGRPLRPGHVCATYTMSYHEIATFVPDTYMPLTRCHITRSPLLSRTPVCHLHDIMSRDRHFRPGHLYATYTMSYHEIVTFVPDTYMPLTRCRITRSSPSSRTPICHFTMSYHEIATSIPDTCMPLTRYDITRSALPSRTPVCHLHDVISRDRLLRPRHLYAIYTMPYP
jgi:hypothetical protein